MEIKHFSKFITPKTAGIIWLTDENIDFSSPGIYEFNYLLDGMLLKSLDNQKLKEEEKAQSNFFLGDNFGSPIFLAHIKLIDKKDLNLIKSHFEAAKSFLKDDATIFIFNKSKNSANLNVLKELSQKYKQYQFENLNL